MTAFEILISKLCCDSARKAFLQFSDQVCAIELLAKRGVKQLMTLKGGNFVLLSQVVVVLVLAQIEKEFFSICFAYTGDEKAKILPEVP